MNNNISNSEIVTLAVYLLGGEFNELDAEDVAVKCFELSPERFSWKKYTQYISLENVRKRLYDARNEEYLVGSDKKGWLLTRKGLLLSKKLLVNVEEKQFSKKSHTLKEKQWLKSEKTRMMASEAFQKIQQSGFECVSQQEAESFFRIDEYVTGETRERKIVRIVNNFSDDEILGEVVIALADKIQKR